MTKPENITPERLRCAVTFSCPSINRLADGQLLIVGKSAFCAKLPPGTEIPELLSTEEAIIIQPDLLDTLKAEWIAEHVDMVGITLSQSTKC